MKKAIRALSLALAFLFVVGMLPFASWIPVREAYAATTTITTDEVIETINGIWAQIGHKYWNKYLGRDKNYTALKNAADTKNYLSVVTDHPCTCTTHDRDHGCRTNQFYGCGQCRGFAKWVSYCVFGSGFFNGKGTEGWTQYTNVTNYTFKPGDIINFKGSGVASHWAVIWSVGGTKLRIIEANYSHSREYIFRCHINTRELSISNLKKEINKYPAECVYSCPAKTHEHTPDSTTGDCSCGKYHEHQYDEHGICKKPDCADADYGKGKGYDSLGRYYSFYDPDFKAKWTSAGIRKIDSIGTARPKSGSGFRVYLLPYMASGTFQIPSILFGQQALTVKQAEVRATVTNHLGNKWYELKVGELETPLYVSVDTVNVDWPPVRIKDETFPKDQATAGKGAKTIVQGTVIATGTELKEVTAAVYDIADLTTEQANNLKGNRYTAEEAFVIAQAKAKYHGHKLVSGTTFYLKEYDSKLKFRDLAGNHTYLYIITATASNGITACSPHEFYLKTSSAAVSNYKLHLVTNGSVQTVDVAKGGQHTLPSRSPLQGTTFAGWSTEEYAETAEYPAGYQFTPSKDGVSLYAVFNYIDPPATPTLVAASYEISLGDTQSISWNPVQGASRYVARVYNEGGQEVGAYTVGGAATMMMIPFAEPGVYTVRLSAENNSLYAGEESAEAVTVTVRPPLTVTYYDEDGSVLLTQSGIRYGTDAPKPEDPARTGYEFLGWALEAGAGEADENALKGIVEDRAVYAVYAEKYYTVTFYDRSGSAQTVSVRHGEKATAPELPATVTEGSDTYSFIGWDNRDWDAEGGVTKDGIAAHPVYLLTSSDLPLTIEIDPNNSHAEIDDEGKTIGYWVYYTIRNRVGIAKMGRAILAAKTSFGKLITQTESGAFYIRGQVDAEYSGNAYIPLTAEGSDMLSLIDVYVVESYHSTKPIATATTFVVKDNTEHVWMTEEEFAALDASDYDSYTTATEYSYRLRLSQTILEGEIADLTGWELVSSETVDGGWSDWSEWQDTQVDATDTREVETQTVQTGTQTQYRYGRYKSTNCSKGTWYHFSDKTGKSLYGGTWSLNYTSWSTTRRSVTSSNAGVATTNNTIGTGRYNSSKSRYYWHKYTIGSANYWWEETKSIPITKVQYRYRDKNPDKTYNTYERWSDWSSWSFDVAEASETQEVMTRTKYNVQMKTITGTPYHYSGAIPSAVGKQALLTVYKVDEASDYSNQYISQILIGSDGSYSFDVYTLQNPTWQTGEFKVALMIEGASEPIQLAPIPVPEDLIPHYTVRFVDGVTGEDLDLQTVICGGSVQAPTIDMEQLHPGYYFLGWDYGLGNIREDMTITARYVEKKYTVVFVDPVHYAITMQTELPFGMELDLPAVEPVEGYTYLGWKTPDGREVSTVEGHMIIVADYEHITYQVTFMSNVMTSHEREMEVVDDNGNVTTQMVMVEEPAVLTTLDVNKFDYIPDLFYVDEYYEDEDDEEEEEEVGELQKLSPKRAVRGIKALTATETEEPEQSFTEDDLGIPDEMYFVGWSEGAEEPVTGNIVLMPILSYYEDTREIEPTLNGGIYVGPQTLQLFEELEEIEGVTIQYRLVTTSEDDPEWVEYDPMEAPDILISETSVLEIEANEENKNEYASSYEYIIVSTDDLPAAPEDATATQPDMESVLVSWSAVADADGYLVHRISDCEEESQFMVENGTTFTDYGVDPLRAYTYSIQAYCIKEKSGASVMLESEAAADTHIMFFGAYQPATSVTIQAPDTVYEGSSIQLSATVMPEDAYDATVSWVVTEGTGEGFITSDGLFYGVTPGTVTVTAKVLDGSEVKNSVSIQVVEVPTGTGNATLTVSSAGIRAGGNATVTVSISEDSLLQAMQFAVVYDSSKLTLVSAESGAVMQNRSPSIGTTEEGAVYFTWEDVESLTDGGSILDMTFRANASAMGTVLVEIPTDGSKPFVFGQADSSPIVAASVNGTLSILQLLLGDVNESGSVNIVDASLIRRYTVKLVTLTETQLLAADVNGDGEVNVIDAHMIRRYIARLLEAFPAA